MSSHQPEPGEAPSTPIRGRPAARYPAALSKGEPGRVPLHRRGTSRTLEAMEDLLRENGYKETRIFTPESERMEALADERRRQSTWRIRELLAGWLPGAGASEDGDTSVPNASRMTVATNHASSAHRSTSPSPLSHKRRLDDHSASSTTLSSLGSPVIEGRTLSYDPSRRHIHDRLPAVRTETSSASLRTQVQVSAARGYLRHMASAPTMPKDRMTAVHGPSVAPLPASWLESVTKAVLRSGDSAHIGGPLPRPSSRQSELPPRATKGGKFALTDRSTNVPRPSRRNNTGLPPGATLYLQPSQTAPGAVSKAHVLCRSAPGSRSSSHVGERWLQNGGGSLRFPPRKDGTERGRRGSRPKYSDRVPSLASTRTENDPLNVMHWVEGKRAPILRLDVENAPYEDAIDSDEEDDDDDDGELDLARLLVPPKRQHSIQSLRKHLHVQHTHTQTRAPTLTADRWEEEEGLSTRGRSNRVDIDEADGYPTFNRAETKRRRGLPGAWGNMAGGRT